MLKAGIFVDMENLNRSGGYALRFRALKEFAEAQGAVVLRANVYMAIDSQREEEDSEYQERKRMFRDRVRREGFHLVLKETQRYYDPDGQVVLKSNSDLDLAVDALLQAENLDYIVLASGDGDFLRLVRALQSRGKRVDLLAFSNVSRALRNEVDYHFSGYLLPGILPDNGDGRVRGIMHFVNEEKGFGFLTMQTGFGATDIREDVFLHIRDFRDKRGSTITNQEFAALRTRGTIIDCELVEQADGREKAVNATEFVPEAYGQ